MHFQRLSSQAAFLVGTLVFPLFIVSLLAFIHFGFEQANDVNWCFMQLGLFKNTSIMHEFVQTHMHSKMKIASFSKLKQ